MTGGEVCVECGQDCPGARVNARGSRCQDVNHKEQESFRLKRPPGKPNSDWDPVNAELSDVVEYLDKFNDMCVAKVTPDEEKQQRCAAEPCSLREFEEAQGGSVHSV